MPEQLETPLQIVSTAVALIPSGNVDPRQDVLPSASGTWAISGIVWGCCTKGRTSPRFRKPNSVDKVLLVSIHPRRAI